MFERSSTLRLESLLESWLAKTHWQNYCGTQKQKLQPPMPFTFFITSSLMPTYARLNLNTSVSRCGA